MTYIDRLFSNPLNAKFPQDGEREKKKKELNKIISLVKDFQLFTQFTSKTKHPPGTAVVPVGWATKPSVLVSSPPTFQDPRPQVSIPRCYLKPKKRSMSC